MESRQKLELALTQEPKETLIIISVPEEKEPPSLTPFLAWVEASVLRNPPTRFKTGMGLTGYFIGAVSTYVGLPLGEDFAQLLNQNATDTGGDAMKWTFGIISYLPTAVLLGSGSQSEFKRFADIMLKKPVCPSYQDTIKNKKHAMRFAHFLSVLAGSPFYTLLEPYFVDLPFLNVAMPVTAFISTYCVCIIVSRELIEKYYARTYKEDAVSQTLRRNLMTKFEVTLHGIQGANRETILLLDEHLRQSALLTLRSLLNTERHWIPRLNHARDDSDYAHWKEILTLHWKRIFLATFALSAGAVSTFVLYEPAQQASVAFWNLLDVTNDVAQDILNNIAATLVTIINSVFDAMCAKMASDHMYDAWTQGIRFPGIIMILSYIVSICSSIPFTDLAIQSSQSLLDIVYAIFVFIGSTLARAMACDELMRHTVAYGRDLLISWGAPLLPADPIELKRQNLTEVVQKIQHSVELLPQRYLSPLTSALEPAQEKQAPPPSRAHRHSIDLASHPESLFATSRQKPPQLTANAPLLRRRSF